METVHALSQEDIDALFQQQSSRSTAGARGHSAQRYDFRRSDRIPNEQIRALRVIHDTFARSLASSLSAYLRTYVSVNLISVEQLLFRDFMSCLPSPTCIATLRIAPFEGMSILEINPSLAFPLIEVMLGGGKIKPRVVEREMTDIERQILDSLLALIVQTLSFSWQSVAKVDFTVEGHETEPGLLHVLPPNEAVVTIATEIQIAEMSGMMNIGIPSSLVKVLRHRFDQQWTARRNAAADEGAKMLARISEATLLLDARMQGSTVSFDDLLRLGEGDILMLDRSIREPVTVSLNGMAAFEGQVMVSGRRKAVTLSGGG
jgi:flagellar motor switch protein FliM